MAAWPAPRSSTRRSRTWSTGSFEPGFRIDLHHKDMGIVTSAAREAGVVVPLGALVAQLMASARANGDGGLDHSALLGASSGSAAATRRSRRHEPVCAPSTPPVRRDPEKEGATQAFGLPGAAINPFYRAMKDHGGINHILARHVEAASHMAEGYTRAKAGNIGVCIGTSGPAGTDMITGLYSAIADSIPILCITGQAPVAKLHKEDFQAVDIASIAGAGLPSGRSPSSSRPRSRAPSRRRSS